MLLFCVWIAVSCSYAKRFFSLINYGVPKISRKKIPEREFFPKIQLRKFPENEIFPNENFPKILIEISRISRISRIFPKIYFLSREKVFLRKFHFFNKKNVDYNVSVKKKITLAPAFRKWHNILLGSGIKRQVHNKKAERCDQHKRSSSNECINFDKESFLLRVHLREHDICQILFFISTFLLRTSKTQIYNERNKKSLLLWRKQKL